MLSDDTNPQARLRSSPCCSLLCFWVPAYIYLQLYNLCSRISAKFLHQFLRAHETDNMRFFSHSMLLLLFTFSLLASTLDSHSSSQLSLRDSSDQISPSFPSPLLSRRNLDPFCEIVPGRVSFVSTACNPQACAKHELSRCKKLVLPDRGSEDCSHFGSFDNLELLGICGGCICRRNKFALSGWQIGGKAKVVHLNELVNGWEGENGLAGSSLKSPKREKYSGPSKGLPGTPPRYGKKIIGAGRM